MNIRLYSEYIYRKVEKKENSDRGVQIWIAEVTLFFKPEKNEKKKKVNFILYVGSNIGVCVLKQQYVSAQKHWQ